MAKLAITLAVVFAALLVASYAHRTTITTVEIEEDNPARRQEGSCREQIQRAQELKHCQQLVQEQSRQGGSRWEESESESETGRRGSRGGSREQLMESRHFQPCCQQIQQIRGEQCRCEGLRQIVRRQQQQQQEGGQFRGGEQMQEVLRSVRYLPSMCGVGPQSCEIRAFWY